MKASIFPNQPVILHHAAKTEIPVIVFIVLIEFLIHIIRGGDQKLIIDLIQVIARCRDITLQQPIQFPVFVEHTSRSDCLK